MMTGTVLDILIYVFDRYMLDEVPEVPEREHLARDLENLIVCAEATCRSAMLRKESRGAHSRIDFPKEDPQLAKVNMCVKKDAEGMSVSATPCPAMPEELRKLLQ